jgi:hypothetical protein
MARGRGRSRRGVADRVVLFTTVSRSPAQGRSGSGWALRLHVRTESTWRPAEPFRIGRCHPSGGGREQVEVSLAANAVEAGPQPDPPCVDSRSRGLVGVTPARPPSILRVPRCHTRTETCPREARDRGTFGRYGSTRIGVGLGGRPSWGLRPLRTLRNRRTRLRYARVRPVPCASTAICASCC